MLYAVGDIHGEDEKLDELLAKLPLEEGDPPRHGEQRLDRVQGDERLAGLGLALGLRHDRLDVL